MKAFVSLHLLCIILQKQDTFVAIPKTFFVIFIFPGINTATTPVKSYVIALVSDIYNLSKHIYQENEGYQQLHFVQLQN